jgi:soluble lytic murein transglycosylase-like protein
MRSRSCAGNSRPDHRVARGARALRPLLASLPLLLAPAAWSAPAAEAQREPEIKSAVQRAIDQAECFEDQYDSAVWYKMMEPRLRKRVPDREERMSILKNVFCEARRAGEIRLPPGLVMAMIDIESGFNRYAVSYAGAVGLMQVMPFWPENLGMRRHQLTKVSENIRMGCAIYRAYLKREKNNIARALARYNGSTGQRWYSDKVIAQWTRWNGADDLGLDRQADAKLVVR